MYRNWNYPNPYSQSQPQWQNQGWNDQVNYNQEPQYHRQITIQEAIDIALAQVPGQAVKAELDTKQGIRVYEVDIVTAQGVKYEVAVNMNTGEIVDIEID
ncbi:PepSY domain-containing protein [Oceanobacillus polygoni]|uniref:Membrane protein YkoI n=1 Tax=Oceanobacillus polygoni TaxID=1235259 RepID=A0A9X1CAQ4_9BACI|nr:PepSY domain-containing protein [Oceanobacillus polygoni]MBP2076914.1 putative membrane protein YkoI [Oceanobacillus polygoni]